MSGEGRDAPAESIIIVRRGVPDAGDHHHGSVWKIAYADFMTAMMAFFLVMWLINAANTEMKASVASYFNPVKLTDSVSHRRGVRDIEGRGTPKSDNEGEATKAKREGAGAKPKEAAKGGGINSGEDRRHRLALTKDQGAPAVKRQESDAAAANARQQGPAFRDPFNPMAHGHPMAKRRTADDAEAIGDTPVKSAKGTVPGETKEAPSKDAKPQDVKGTSLGPGLESPKGEVNDSDKKEEQRKAAARAGAEMVAKQVEKEIRAILQRAGITGGPAIDIVIEDDAVVISLTDTSTFGMFAIGSAEPNQQLIEMLKYIVPVIVAHSDRVILRGHTDSRPFRSDRNGNWRLSMERAEVASKLLVQSGLNETRLEKIEAHADKRPRVSSDTMAAANRRIEILLRQARR